MIKEIKESELTKMCVELLSKTYLDLGQHNIDAKTKVIIAQSLASDLKKSFSSLTWRDIEMSFWNGVRNTDDFNISAKTYYKWIKLWRQIIWDNEVIPQKQRDKRLSYKSETKLITNK